MKNRKIDYIILCVLIVLSGLTLFYNGINLGLDLKGGTYIVLQARGEIESDTMDKVRDIVDRRINSLGVSEPVIQLSGTDRLIVELAGISDPQQAIDLIGTTAKLEFKIKNQDGTYGETLLEGSAIKNANLSQGQFGQPEVAFELDQEGAMIFEKITRENIGRQLAIMLDGIEQSAPVINSAIPGGRGVITTGSVEDARNLTNLLKSGALPVNIDIIETRTVGATLGVESIEQTKIAGIISFVIIGLFMILIYKIPGFIADIVLLIYGLFTLGVFSAIGATMTLPGIAGFILTLGMVVDSNIITFERIKEEMAKGRTLNESIEYGFKNGLPAILDGNITTLLIAIVLFFFGTGPIKGFAVTLAIGTMITLVTALFVTKVIFVLVVKVFKIKRNQLFWKEINKYEN